MLRMLKSEFGVSNDKLAKLALKDELTVLSKLKKTHHKMRNRKAAVKIQSMSKMYMIRKRYLALMHLRRYSAGLLTSHYRKQIAIMRF
jgi:hypothetical protein